MTNDQIYSLMQELCGNALGVCRDEVYSLPDEHWFYSEFAVSAMEHLKALGLLKYRPQENDCDDFASNVAQWGQALETNDGQRQGAALAIGVFWYQPESSREGEGHAINFAITDTKSPRLIFLEPQTCLKIPLSSSELRSCYRWEV